MACSHDADHDAQSLRDIALRRRRRLVGVPRLDRGRRRASRAALPRRRAAGRLSWGRAGIGACELARAITQDATGSSALAERHCREMTHAIIARLPDLGFELDRDEVLAWLESEAGPSTTAPL
jgi:Family of unknown function (DUF6166)